MKNFALIGCDIQNSKSPKIIESLCNASGIYAKYHLIDVIPLYFMRSLIGLIDNGGYNGINITSPFKQDAYNCLLASNTHLLARSAILCKSVNCIELLPGRRAVGHNTDIDGIYYSIFRTNFSKRDRKTALIIGSGGTVEACKISLMRLGLSEYDIHEISRKVPYPVAGATYDIIIDTLPKTSSCEPILKQMITNHILNMNDGGLFFSLDYQHTESNEFKSIVESCKNVEFMDGIRMLNAQAQKSLTVWLNN